MQSFLASMNQRWLTAMHTHEGLCRSTALKGVYDCGTVPVGHAFNIKLVNATKKHGFTEVTVNHHLGVDPNCFEISLKGPDGFVANEDLGMFDVWQFGSFDELVAGLLRLANNQPVNDYEEDEDDDEEDTN